MKHLKTNLITITFLFIFFNTFSQSSMSFPKDSAKWVEVSGYASGIPGDEQYDCLEYLMSGDTIIDTVEYSKVYSAGNLYALVRENNKRIYVRYSNNDTLEMMLYDFNAKENDTLTIYLENYYNEFLPCKIEIISAYTEPDSRKSWDILSIDDCELCNSTTIYWVEGIGSSNGLFYNTYLGNKCGEEFSLLHAFYLKDSLVYGDSILCERKYTSVNTLIKEEAKLLVKPNPASDIINIDIQGVNNYNAKIQIFDLQGRLLYVNPFEQIMNIDISHFSPGIYFIHVTDYNRQINFKSRFIKTY